MRIVIEGVDKSFKANHILKGLDLTFGDGAFVTLLGPSGCGKTTTLRCIAGLENPDAGTISVGDRVFADARRHRYLGPHKRKIGMVFQSYALWPHMTVSANVAYPLKLRRVSAGETRRLVERTLEAVGMAAHSRRYPHELSGGQQQRVALARGLVSAGGVMLFDEPLSNLDAKLRVAMRTEIRRLHDEFGNTSVYVTHDQEEALALSDRIVILNGGRVEQVGRPEEIHARPATRFAADFVGFENILDCVAHDSGAAVLEGGLRFEAAGRALPEPGTALAFRGRSIRLGVCEGAAITGRGIVRHSTYVGDEWIAGLELEGGREVSVTIPEGAGRSLGRGGDGTAVEFSVPAGSVVGLER